MKRVLIAIGFATLAAPGHAAAPPVTGRWLTPGGKAIVEVRACGAQMCGQIVKVIKPKPGSSPYDENNSDPALRKRPVLGLVILTGFTATDDRWKGRVYDPITGRSYRSEMTREGDVLKVKGCLGPFCQTQAWSKTS